MFTRCCRQRVGGFIKNKPVIIGVIVAVLILAMLGAYIYKSSHFQVESIGVGTLTLLSKTSNAGIKLSTSDSNPTITINYSGLPNAPIKMAIDGQELNLKNKWLWGQAVGQADTLVDGDHIFSLNIGTYDERWLINIDTEAPKVTISHPVEGYRSNKKQITLQGTTEPLAVVTAKIGDQTKTTQANQKGWFSLIVPTHKGKCLVEWEAHDAAMNSTKGSREFICDFDPPVLNPTIIQPPCTKAGQQFDQIEIAPKTPYTILISKNLKLKINASDEASGIAKLDIYIDESLRESQDYTKPNPAELQVEKLAANAEAGNETSNTEQLAKNLQNSASTTAQEAAQEKKSVEYSYKLPVLFEGTHVVTVVATDTFGLSTKRSITFGLDTTETYGQAPMGLGAVGKDVSELQRRLVARGYLKEGYTDGKYDQKTRQAVIQLQKEANLGQDGIAGAMVTSALDTRIYVNLSQYDIVVVDAANNRHYYHVAIGVDEHPTPTGTYYIIDMVKNPTWLPPNSEWAKDAKPVDPGADNPLGTRWIGIGNAIGFHGTPYPWTVSTKSSHGCMRMAIPDIEDMYERVNVGTLVYIFSGNEDDPILKTYWPSSSAPAYSETDSGGNSGDSDATNNGDGSSSGD